MLSWAVITDRVRPTNVDLFRNIELNGRSVHSVLRPKHRQFRVDYSSKFSDNIAQEPRIALRPGEGS